MTQQFDVFQFFKTKKLEYFNVETQDQLLKFLKELYFWPNILFYYKRDFSKFTLERQLQYKEYAEDEVNKYFDERAADFLFSYEIQEPSYENKDEIEYVKEVEMYYKLQQRVVQEFNEILEYLGIDIIEDSIEYVDENVNNHNIVFYFKPINLYLGATGYSWSTQRSDFDENFYKIIQKEKLVTVWEKVE